MKALVYGGPGKKSLEQRPRPAIQAPGDAIVRIVKTTICGTDLHILKGDVPTCEPGRILGHEGIGIVEEVGVAVTGFKRGDRVLISCISADGTCEYCRRGMYSHCVNGGWILSITTASSSTAARQNMCARRMRTRASITSPKASMRMRL